MTATGPTWPELPTELEARLTFRYADAPDDTQTVVFKAHYDDGVPITINRAHAELMGAAAEMIQHTLFQFRESSRE